jgi:hypothetical protein
MSFRSTLMMLAALSWAGCASLAAAAEPDQQPSQNARPKLDPNQRICEDVTQVGSRLATKRICATRAQWAEMRKQDREAVDNAQRSANVGCNTVNTHSGTPSC